MIPVTEEEKTYKERCGHCALTIEYWPLDGTYRDLRYRTTCPGTDTEHEPKGLN